MKLNFKILYILPFILGIVPALSYGHSILAEPYLGYCQTVVYGNKDSNQESKQSGILFGEKIGIPFNNYFALLDFNACIGSNTPRGQKGNNKKKGTIAALYLIGGLAHPKYPDSLRFWAGFTPLSSLSIEYDDMSNGIFYRGQGVKLGMGYTPSHFASYNLELLYQRYGTYREKIAHVDGGTKPLSRKINHVGIYLSASIPIRFDHIF